MRILLALIVLLWLPGAMALSIYTEDWPPITFQRNGIADGMAVEVVREIQARIHDNSSIDVVPWVRGYRELETTANVMLFTVGRSDAREKIMTLVGPVAVSQTVLLCRKGEAAGLLALGSGIFSRPVGAYRGSIFADAAVAAGFVEVDLAPTPQVAAQKLLGGRYDLWSEGSFVVAAVLKDIRQPADAVEVVRVLESLDLYLAFSRGTSGKIIRRWYEGLAAIKKDGTFRRIYNKWLPHEIAPLEVRQLGLPPAP
ncbi:ABC-type amino acid transport, signal transduction system, periplasmic component [Aquitalea magnusonii]|uniref:ABC-type amino acid transport, signal transduction system, periplasmic component n=1 Tax=Aquitalea magnusonii TaxID=332411 RepID=A0A3G9GCQ7_9NEIS|nr:transporter substrate-binding domain-containing protein [Aquitalea magnusonii]BBF85638.1 ABC-type amino acid transport, signal transduction system, periplasmic component [Aquitalea magnusonii]